MIRFKVWNQSRNMFEDCKPGLPFELAGLTVVMVFNTNIYLCEYQYITSVVEVMKGLFEEREETDDDHPDAAEN